MSENVNSNQDGINININNSDSNQGGGGSGSFIDKIFDLGLKLLIPILLVFALFAIVIFFGVVLPILQDVSDIVLPVLGGDGAFGLPLSPALSGIAGGLGAIAGWIFGR